MNKKTVNKILNRTEKGYDLISEKFSQTRNRFWGSLEFIKKYTEDNDNVLDYGCGNGRLLELFDGRDINYQGVDVSGRLIQLAKKKHENRKSSFVKLSASQTSLPFPENFFNIVYSIAVFHHIPSKELRYHIARELFKVTKPDGYIVVTVWNLWPNSYLQLFTNQGNQKKCKNIFKNWTEKILGKSELDWNDCLINFTDNKGNVFERYHHAFVKREIRNLFEKVGFETENILKIGGNIVFVGKKEKSNFDTYDG